MENRELNCTNTYHGAHLYAITDISAHCDEELFVSVSRDKSALIWDHRQVRPAIGLLSAHRYHLTSCNWRDNTEHPSVVLIGDAQGDVFQVDRRNPDKIVSLVSAFDRPVRKIGRCANKWIMCGNSTELKAVAAVGESDRGLVESLVSSPDWIRDFTVNETEQQQQVINVLSMDGTVQKIAVGNEWK